jgi:hypothetical protein
MQQLPEKSSAAHTDVTVQNTDSTGTYQTPHGKQFELSGTAGEED